VALTVGATGQAHRGTRDMTWNVDHLLARRLSSASAKGRSGVRGPLESAHTRRVPCSSRPATAAHCSERLDESVLHTLARGTQGKRADDIVEGGRDVGSAVDGVAPRRTDQTMR